MDSDLRRGVWRRPPAPGLQLYQKTLGIVGLGKVGRVVAERLRGFEMRILGYDPFVSPAEVAASGIEAVDLRRLIEESDIISLHVPLSSDTRHLIGREELERMKPTAYLINTARGEIVDQRALYEALKAGRIAGAGLDVFDPEPLGEDPITTLPNVVLTAHIAGLSWEAVAAMAALSAESAVRVLRGERTEYAVNPAAFGIRISMEAAQ